MTHQKRIDVARLIDATASAERRLREETFLAPAVRGGLVRVRVGGLVRSFVPRPNGFEGWGLFRQRDERTASVVEEAPLPLVDRYLRLFAPIRLVLAYRVGGRSWVAVPANASDARQRRIPDGPCVVHLAERVSAFDRIVAQHDGGAFWFEAADSRADPILAERLRESLANTVAADRLAVPGLTSEHALAYAIASVPDTGFAAPRRHEARPRAAAAYEERSDEGRLRRALGRGGGRLLEHSEQGDCWIVHWTTSDGERHTSAVTKGDLTVVSSGVCLSGRDRDFDLLSLVGVIEQRD